MEELALLGFDGWKILKYMGKEGRYQGYPSPLCHHDWINGHGLQSGACQTTNVMPTVGTAVFHVKQLLSLG
jgi:hypothetical protein